MCGNSTWGSGLELIEWLVDNGTVVRLLIAFPSEVF